MIKSGYPYDSGNLHFSKNQIAGRFPVVKPIRMACFKPRLQAAHAFAASWKPLPSMQALKAYQLLVEPPLWKRWKSVGTFLPNIWKKSNMFEKPPTSQPVCFALHLFCRFLTPHLYETRLCHLKIGARTVSCCHIFDRGEMPRMGNTCHQKLDVIPVLQAKHNKTNKTSSVLKW